MSTLAPPTVPSLLIAFMLLLLWGCASTGIRTEELLQQDFATMSDAELESYYIHLNDQIARLERQAGRTRVGLGVGSYPVRIGASTAVGTEPGIEELRERRNAVRQELGRRGLRP